MESSLKLAQNDIAAGKHCIVCLDENSAGLKALIAGANCLYISNRFDIAKNLNSKKTPVSFSDWVIDAEAGSQDLFIFRLSKEKAINHHLLNQALKVLKPDGRLIFSGQKNDGFKTYAKKVSTCLGASHTQKNGSHYIFEGRSPLITDQFLLDDSDYGSQQDIGNGFTSKPGQFGWNKFDQGSELLVNALLQDLATCESTYKSLLDLGCGYGFITKHLAETLTTLQEIIASDNNAAALLSAEVNLAGFVSEDRSVDVIGADCAESIDKTFDIVVCNPPFHQGFDVENQLTDKFLKSARDHLNRKGTAYFVVNSFIGIEKKSKAYFPNCETLVNNKRFKVLKLQKSKT